MKNHNSPKLQSLVGKSVLSVYVSNSHGEVLIITFTDGTKLNVCSVVGTEKEKGSWRDDIYVSIDDQII